MPEKILPPVKPKAETEEAIAAPEVIEPALSLPEQFREGREISDAHHAALRLALPKEAIERTESSRTGKGYNTTGYGYQWVADRFDEVFGPEHWRETRTVISAEAIPWGSSATGCETVFESTIQVGWWVNAEGRVPQFCTIASHSHYGGHSAKLASDAYKGGATNAFKKCAAFGYGVGSDAWRDAIDEDNQDAESGVGQGRGASPSSATPPPSTEDWDGTKEVWFGQHKGKQFKDIKDDDLLFWYEKLDNAKIKQCAQAELTRRRFNQDDDLPI